ncbi:MAG: undecaprenyl-diphosphate phosphatase [Opitutae bacterium]
MPRTLLFLFLICPFALFGAEQSNPDKTAEEVRDQFTTQRAIVTGLVEGITEYLPVSSTGHMIISDAVMGVDKSSTQVEASVVDRKGRRLSLEKIADDYIVIIQLGAILAVLFIFYQRMSSVIIGIFKGRRSSIFLALAVLIAFLPAAIVGLLVKDYIPFNVTIVALALIIGGFVIIIAEEKLPKIPSDNTGELNVTPQQAVWIGLCQCVALIPGTSRSLATILGGRWAGLSSAVATEFSFLVGFVILSAASVYKMYSLGPALLKVYPIGNASLGLLVAALAAFISVKWMIGFIMRRGLKPFAWYRIIAGLLLLGAKSLGYF